MQSSKMKFPFPKPSIQQTRFFKIIDFLDVLSHVAHFRWGFLLNLGLGAAAYQLGNTCSRMISEVKAMLSSVSNWMGDFKCCLSVAANP